MKVVEYLNLQQLPHPLEEPKEPKGSAFDKVEDYEKAKTKYIKEKEYFDFWSRFEIRKLFVADDGYEVVAADYHALEKFLTAHLSQDKVLLKMLRENLDPHGTVATIVFPELANINPNDVKKVAPDKRQTSKTVGFA